jgi:LPXTG-site transpeptidase (sortase) family protein
VAKGRVKAHAKKHLRTVKRQPLQIALLVFGSLFITYGLSGLISWYANTHFGPKVPLPKSYQRSGQAPNEKPVKVTDDYKVPADQPRVLRLPTIGAEGLVQQLGVNNKGEVGTPSNVHMAGWFNQSVKPGQTGLSIIDGHVSGYYSDGIFKKLDQMKKGDRFVVEFGDHSTKTFEVVSVKSYPADQATAALFKQDLTIKKQLSLITCGGKYNRKTKEYENRIIVVSRLV